MSVPASLRFLNATLVCAALWVVPGCAGRPPADEQSAAAEITVAAAANLTDAFGEVAKQFTAETGVRVLYSFGATADLAKQIENGAPFDVYAAADVSHVDGLDGKGLLTPGTRALYARGRLVLWTPPGGRAQVSRPEDLARPEVKSVAVAKPELAPYGKAAVEALRALDLWPQVGPKLVYAQNVSQAKQFAASGNAEAAFLPLALLKPGEGRHVGLDEQLHRPIDQALGVLKASGRQEAARRFTAFVLGEEGRRILEQYGYQKPPAVGP